MVKILNEKQFRKKGIRKEIPGIGKIENRVFGIISDVRGNGDSALLKYERRFGQADLTLKAIEVSSRERKEAFKRAGKKTVSALKRANSYIFRYYKSQIPKVKTIKYAGIEISQVVRPIGRAGCYIPGGVAPLVSTVLMTVSAAKAAGVEEIIVCTPSRNGGINPAIIAAAEIAGAGRIFKVGGAQAIAAMAYGTKTIPAVDKIFGPGNIYVTTAKRLVYGDVGIDFPAGPSEIAIIADDSSNPDFIASDILAQSEHDVLSRTYLITPSRDTAFEVKKRILERLKKLKRADSIGIALQNCNLIIADNINSAFRLANEIAPEHLEIMADAGDIEKIKSAGEIFLGSYSCVAIGDYILGSHVLPTGGFARTRGGLSALDFLKIITTQRVSKEGLKKLRQTALRLAEIESMEAHANSIKARFGE